jgi:predicted ATP-dependent serine protease
LTRLREARKLGFKQAVLPAAGEFDEAGLKLALARVAHIKDLAETLGP